MWARSGRMTTRPSATLDTFPNPRPARDYGIHFDCPEFTCLCPLTGQPDFATFKISYVPDEKCIELKSLKLYMWSFRNEGAFHEAVTNRILEDLVKACAPPDPSEPGAHGAIQWLLGVNQTAMRMESHGSAA